MSNQNNVDGSSVEGVHAHEWMTPTVAARLLVCAVHLGRSHLLWDIAVRAGDDSSIGVRWGAGTPWDHDSAGIAADAALESVASGQPATPAILDMIDDAMRTGTTAWHWSHPAGDAEQLRGADEGPGTVLTRLHAETPEAFTDSTHAFAQELLEQLDTRITAATHRLTSLAAAAPMHITVDDTQLFLASI